jgi:hypothetical protein
MAFQIRGNIIGRSYADLLFEIGGPNGENNNVSAIYGQTTIPFQEFDGSGPFGVFDTFAFRSTQSSGHPPKNLKNIYDF